MSNRISFIAVLLTGLLLLGLSVPRTAAYGVMAVGDDALVALGRSEPVTRSRLRAAIASRQAALGWMELPGARIELGGLNLILARDKANSGKVRRAFLDQSIAAYRAGLSLAPMRPFAWLQYAQARARQDAASVALNAPLRLSYITAPLEPRLVQARVRLAFFARNRLNPDNTSRARNDLRLAARNAPNALSRFARDHYAIGWITRQMQGDPASLRKFMDSYARRARP